MISVLRADEADEECYEARDSFDVRRLVLLVFTAVIRIARLLPSAFAARAIVSSETDTFRGSNKRSN